MDWQALGAIAGVLSFLLVLAVEWRRLRRVGVRQIVIALPVGVGVLLAVALADHVFVGLEPSPTQPTSSAGLATSTPPLDTGGGGGFPTRFLSETDVPGSTTMHVLVDPGTIHALSSGPICVEGECLPGGETNGSVVILLPRDVPYEITNLVPTQNWHGAYHGSPDQWRVLAEFLASQMQMPGNCTGGRSCDTVYILVVDGGGVVARQTVTR